MPRQSADEDSRPIGLKLARNNFFSFPKKENSVFKRSSVKEENRQSTTSTTSPTLPARSPFRIRDSQASRKSAQEVKRVTHTEEPYSSLSSSTSSITTLDDDLSQELENIWKIKSPKHHQIKSDVQHQDLFLQLLVSQAMIDAQDYQILSFEKLESLKERHDKLKVQVRNSVSKLELDKKIQETSHSLSQLASNRQSVLISRDEAMAADRKVAELSKQLKDLKVEESETQYRILEHTAGVLRLGLQQFEKKKASYPSRPISEIKSDIEQITNTLLTILKKHNIQQPSRTDTLGLLHCLEQHMERYQSQTKEIQSRLISMEEELGEKETSEKRQLQNEYIEVARLKALVAGMEIQFSKIQAQTAAFEQREQDLKKEIEQYREQVLTLRNEKERLERTVKRQTIVLDTEAKFEQQLEEQEQEYQAQLKEQAALLDKTARECERIKEEHDKLAATCQDLEWLVEGKSKGLDDRDVQISRLEAELRQGNMGQIQSEFALREAAWIEQSAAMEANFEGILKEFDRLTGTAMEFENDKANYERRIEMLTQEVKQLEASLQEEKTKNLGFDKVTDTPTTASLRKEFRKMINDMQLEHQRALEKEAEEKKQLEKQLKDLKHEREMARYERINKGVQTPLFIS
ncbi:uncharacterized protein RHIMIDRAFT_242424 [Rhizopus microsporus ATCC 52813]|uniref:Up-regulated during septation protein 1 domain-containing protein n=1 Tax=Rhizopus microsporus ATCC 52813 TaxID=1340429 RepID=A0A2G4SFR9_RHIZD|nr:uncharacterized protein RHIMIDRAFT_242424 [Rhizopus microsporus ATCC 52813]PHZ07610.1 hypothetical protein RHIMIDRAFT_242424 [Rhizopus microsporus ATCC 52813]